MLNVRCSSSIRNSERPTFNAQRSTSNEDRHFPWVFGCDSIRNANIEHPTLNIEHPSEAGRSDGGPSANSGRPPLGSAPLGEARPRRPPPLCVRRGGSRCATRRKDFRPPRPLAGGPAPPACAGLVFRTGVDYARERWTISGPRPSTRIPSTTAARRVVARRGVRTCSCSARSAWRSVLRWTHS